MRSSLGKVMGLALLAGIGLTACDRLPLIGKGRGGVPPVPLPFEADLDRGEDRRDFTVTVAARGASLEQVRESARFEATRYCLVNYGSSAADWALDGSGDWAVTRFENGSLAVSGRCIAR